MVSFALLLLLLPVLMAAAGGAPTISSRRALAAAFKPSPGKGKSDRRTGKCLVGSSVQLRSVESTSHQERMRDQPCSNCALLPSIRSHHARYATPTEAHRLADWLHGCKRVVSLTGAGISTESGIPDYRSPQGSYSRCVGWGEGEKYVMMMMMHLSVSSDPNRPIQGP